MSITRLCALGVTVVAACVAPRELESPRVRARLLAGCYSLEVRLYESAASSRPFDGLHALRLTTESLSAQRPDLYRVEALRDPTGDVATRYPVRAWHVGESTDSVHVGFSHLFGGLALALRPREDSLVGVAVLISDIAPFERRVGRVSAARIGCPRGLTGRVRTGAG